MAQQLKEQRLAKLEELRKQSIEKVKGPVAKLLARSFEFIATVVGDGVGDSESVCYAVELFSADRVLAYKHEKEISDPLRHMIYELGQAIGTVVAVIMEGRISAAEPEQEAAAAAAIEQIRTHRLGYLEYWRSESTVRVKGPLGNLLSRTFEFICTVVRDGVKDASVGYAIEAFSADRQRAKKFDKENADPLRQLIYGLTEAVGTLVESIVEDPAAASGVAAAATVPQAAMPHAATPSVAAEETHEAQRQDDCVIVKEELVDANEDVPPPSTPAVLQDAHPIQPVQQQPATQPSSTRQPQKRAASNECSNDPRSKRRRDCDDAMMDNYEDMGGNNTFAAEGTPAGRSSESRREKEKRSSGSSRRDKREEKDKEAKRSTRGSRAQKEKTRKAEKSIWDEDSDSEEDRKKEGKKKDEKKASRVTRRSTRSASNASSAKSATKSDGNRSVRKKSDGSPSGSSNSSSSSSSDDSSDNASDPEYVDEEEEERAKRRKLKKFLAIEKEKKRKEDERQRREEKERKEERRRKEEKAKRAAAAAAASAAAPAARTPAAPVKVAVATPTAAPAAPAATPAAATPPIIRNDVHKCKDCGRIFDTQSGLNAHIQRTHWGIKCEYCKLPFSKEKIDPHMEKSHPDKPPRKDRLPKKEEVGAAPAAAATTVTRATSSPAVDVKPVIAALAAAEWKCDKCPRVFTSQRGLQHHGHQHFGSKCDYCPMRLAEEKMHNHVKNDHPDKQIVSIPCPQCGAVQVSKAGLDEHVRQKHRALPSSSSK